MTAAVWCKEHVPTKTIVHRMHDIVDDTGLNALQLYVRNFKQADLALTGTVRKANLAYQSTKVVNQVPAITAPNRRTSTATIVSNGARGSISNIKLEETGNSGSPDIPPSPISAAEAPRTCITCGIDVSPFWHPYPPIESNRVSAPTGWPNSTSLAGSEKRPGLAEDVNPSEGASLLTNGHSTQNGESPKHHAALAAAALKEKSQEVGITSVYDQCHKCHRNRVQKPSPSPLQAIASQQDIPRSQLPTVTPSVPTPIPPLPSPQTQAASHFSSWHPHQAAYTSPGSFSSWTRPPPTTQSAASVHQFNGNQSPRSTGSTILHLTGSPQVRQPPIPMPRSPHLNGPLTQQLPNGYPTSPHRGVVGAHQVQNGGFGSYASTRPPPQHLTNGGPPLHAPESPFSQNGRSLHHSSFSSRASPPVPRESPLINRENISQGHGGRSNDGRANGGASANPSLHNLLS
jgi:hypothetical protein